MNNLYRPIFWIILIFVLSISKLSAQDSTEVDFQTWMDFRTFYNKTEKLVYDGEFGLRGIISGEAWQRIYIHPAIQYALNLDFNLRGGIRFIFTQEADQSNTFEIRPWQGVRILWPRPGFMVINHYFRLEERLTLYTQSDETDFVFRLRYRIMTKTPNLTLKAIKQVFYLYASFEIFANAGAAIKETYVDRNRLTFGWGWLISPSWRSELVYTRQNARGETEEGFNNNVNVFRLRIRFYINPQF